jgi:hypothetical protein
VGYKKSQQGGPSDVLVSKDGHGHNMQVISCCESALTWIDWLGDSSDDAYGDHFEYEEN